MAAFMDVVIIRAVNSQKASDFEPFCTLDPRRKCRLSDEKIKDATILHPLLNSLIENKTVENILVRVGAARLLTP